MDEGNKSSNMKKHKNSKLRYNSQQLRKNQTKEEQKLWYGFLKDLPFTVNRQKVFNNYIVDFYCASIKLVIEIDGSRHFEKEGHLKDKYRDKYFSDNNIRVLRYSNYDINYNFDGVCQDILEYIKQSEG